MGAAIFRRTRAALLHLPDIAPYGPRTTDVCLVEDGALGIEPLEKGSKKSGTGCSTAYCFSYAPPSENCTPRVDNDGKHCHGLEVPMIV